MHFILILISLLIFGCGQKNNNKTVLKSPKLDSKERAQHETISNQFFQVNIKSFSFKTDDMELFKDLELQKNSKFEFYELLSGLDFLNKQLVLPINKFEGNRISTHVESFALDKRKVHQAFQYFSLYKNKKFSLREIKIRLKAYLDIDSKILKKISGIDIIQWNQYENTESEIAHIPMSYFEKSNEYKDRYKISLDKNIPQKILNQLVLKDLRLVFRLNFKYEKPIVQFFYKSNNFSFIKTFKKLSQLHDFLKKEKKRLILNEKKIIHNLDELHRNNFFYYFLETDKEIIEGQFPFLMYEEEEFIADNVIRLNDEKYLKAEFDGGVVKEKWRLGSYYKQVSGVSKEPLEINFNCEMKFQKIDGNILSPISAREISEKQFLGKSKFDLRYHYNDKNFFLSMDKGDLISIVTPTSLYQHAIVGRFNKHSDCQYFGFNDFSYHQKFVYERRAVTKKSILKFKGRIKKYYIPWNLIYWSESSSKISHIIE